jgi:hypothetical protein
MRWIFLLFLFVLPVSAGCDKGTRKMDPVAMKVGGARAPEAQQDVAEREFAVQKQEAGAPGAAQAPKPNEPAEK